MARFGRGVLESPRNYGGGGEPEDPQSEYFRRASDPSSPYYREDLFGPKPSRGGGIGPMPSSPMPTMPEMPPIPSNRRKMNPIDPSGGGGGPPSFYPPDQDPRGFNIGRGPASNMAPIETGPALPSEIYQGQSTQEGVLERPTSGRGPASYLHPKPSDYPYPQLSQDNLGWPENAAEIPGKGWTTEQIKRYMQLKGLSGTSGQEPGSYYTKKGRIK